MKTFFLNLFSWALIAAASTSAGAQGIPWQSDLEAAQQLAGKENKLVLLHFTADWCHPCKTLDTFVYSNPQVQRSMQSNVVPVKIDVDAFPNLVREYGVSGVPFDVAITPAGRIVSKRSSPREASSYNNMIQGFSKTIGALAKGNNPALNEQLDELKDALFSDNQIVEHPELTPISPEVAAPQPSFHSRELKRREEHRQNAKIVNPYATATIVQTEPTKPADPQRITNNFVLPPVPIAAQTNVIPEEKFSNELPKRTQASGTVQSNPIAAADVTLDLSNHRSKPNADSMASLVVPGKIEPSSPSNDFVGNLFSKNEMPTKAITDVDAHQVANEFRLAGTRNEAAPVGFSSSAVRAQAEANDQAKTPGFALHGKCPVTLLKEGRWIDGDAQFGCVHRRRTYLFSSESKMKEFQSDPDAFSPLLAGYDPVVYERTGELVNGDVEHGVFMGKMPNQRVVLFATPESRAEFQAQPRIYIEKIRAAMQASGGSSSNIMR